MHSSESPPVWRKIEALMTSTGMSAKDLAEIAGVVPSAVVKWKRGAEIGTSSLLRIANHFGKSLDDLVQSCASQYPSGWSDECASRKVVRESESEYGSSDPCRIIVQGIPDDALQGTFNAILGKGSRKAVTILAEEMDVRKHRDKLDNQTKGDAT